MFRIGLRVNTPIEFVDLLEKSDPEKSEKLEYFRKLILDHLSKLEKEDTENLKKSLLFAESLVKGGYPVGTIRVWKGRKYVKIAPGDWRPKYDSHSRGAKMAISAIKKRIAAARDTREMLQIVLANRDRFSDKDGHPLPFVQELSKYVDEAQEKLREPPKTPSKKKIGLPDNKKGENQKPKTQNKEKADGGKTAGNSKDSGFIDSRNYPTERQTQRVTVNRESGIIVGRNNNHFKIRFDDGYEGVFDESEINFGQPKGKKQDKSGPKDKVRLGLRIKSSKDSGERTDNEKSDSGNKWIDKIAAMSYEEFNKLSARDKMTYNHFIYKLRDKIVKRYERMEDKKDINDELTLALEKFAKKYVKQPESSGKDTPEKMTPEQTALLDGLNSQSLPSVQGSSKVPPESGEKSSDFEAIRDKYQSAKAETGDEDEIQAGKEVLSGVWKLVEADTPTASHDETTFRKTPGFPTNADGSSINDRDYEHFQANKEAVINIASEFDGRALKFDNPVIVTKDGIVISGNNRTMSSKIAARRGTDKKYIEALKKRAKKFGFTEEQVSQFKNPRVVFEVENSGGYTTEQFAKFNESTKKTMGPTERAIKVSKIMKPETIETVAGMISEYDTMGDLYKDQKASQKLLKTFQDAGLIGQNAEGEFVENGVITPAGKSFIETALLGSVVNEANLLGFNRPGCLSIRATLVRAITPLIENKGLSGYSINAELNEAVDIAMQVAINRDKFRSVDDFARQQSMFEKYDPVAVELAKKLEGTQKSFAEFMQKLNGGLKYAANGEADIFLGGVETKGDIINRFFNIRKAVTEVLNAIKGLF
jgi:hypothetical protein